jgi:hypothetical protein
VLASDLPLLSKFYNRANAAIEMSWIAADQHPDNDCRGVVLLKKDDHGGSGPNRAKLFRGRFEDKVVRH